MPKYIKVMVAPMMSKYIKVMAAPMMPCDRRPLSRCTRQFTGTGSGKYGSSNNVQVY
jgi:hypothetical protein